MTRFRQEEPAGAGPQLRSVVLTSFASELEAQGNSRIDRGPLQEAVCKAIRHLRPHDTEICGRSAWQICSPRRRKPHPAVRCIAERRWSYKYLPRSQRPTESYSTPHGNRRHSDQRRACLHISHHPKYLKDLVGGKVGVVNGAERIAARDETAGRQWIIRVCERPRRGRHGPIHSFFVARSCSACCRRNQWSCGPRI
jgi:hypothetical protein